MKVFIERDKKHIERSFTGTAQDLLDELGINKQTVLLLKDGVLVPESADISEAKEIDILTVVSGG